MIKLKRAYEPPSPQDGTRILVERLWPRGLAKKEAAVDLWLKEVAPSTELRKWFAHDPAKWNEFRKRYRQELRQQKEAVALLRQKARTGTVTLVYAARDEEHNGALVLHRFLAGRSRSHAGRKKKPPGRRASSRTKSTKRRAARKPVQRSNA